MAELSITFWVLAEEMGRGNKALKGGFIHSLSDHLKDKLATKEEPKTLHDAIKVVV